MTPRLLLEPEAELDLEGARIWYEERAKGLGSEFLRNVRATLAVIERQPDLFPLVHATVQRRTSVAFPTPSTMWQTTPSPRSSAACTRAGIPQSGSHAVNSRTDR